MAKFGKKYHLSLLLMCAVFISACGFHLRGSVAISLPPGVEPIYIGGIKAGDQLAVELRNLLGAQNIQLSDNPASANYQLRIVEQNQDRRSAALGDGARTAEYQLTNTVTFEMLDTKGRRVFGPNSITERKNMRNDPNQVISTNQEEKIIRREMLRNLAAKIARQIQSFDYPAATAAANSTEPVKSVNSSSDTL